MDTDRMVAVKRIIFDHRVTPKFKEEFYRHAVR
jgi:hypothetical protein